MRSAPLAAVVARRAAARAGAAMHHSLHVRRAVVNHEPTAVSFSVFSAEHILKLSVLKVTNPLIFDNLNRPVRNGLYDPRLGAYDKNDRNFRCGTCKLGRQDCPGHGGHIELPLPVYNPIMFAELFRLLKAVCPHCHRFRAASRTGLVLAAKLRLLDAGLLVETAELESRLFAFMAQSYPERLAKKPSAAAGDDTTAGSDQRDEMPAFGAALKLFGETELAQMLADYVNKSIQSAGLRQSESSSMRATRTIHASRVRRELVLEYFKSMTQRCLNCNAVAPKYRREGASKLFELPLPAKAKRGRKADRDDGSDSDGDVRVDKHAADDANADDALWAHFPVVRIEPCSGGEPRFMAALEVLTKIRDLANVEGPLLAAIFPRASTVSASAASNGKPHRFDPYQFFLQVLFVPPARFRPAGALGDITFENPMNGHLQRVLRLTGDLYDLCSLQTAQEASAEAASGEPPLAMTSRQSAVQVAAANVGASLDSRVITLWLEIQAAVNSLFDADADRGAQAAGIRQSLEKKQGLFRKNMMGKRVNYAARSVISPDPLIETNEIGVPVYFAQRLCYPEPVGNHNYHAMRQLVINGPNKYPGAMYVEDARGFMTDLSGPRYSTEAERESLSRTLLKPTEGEAPGSVKVWRHLQNGDMMLVNRQPTLHKPGIMAHRARVLGGGHKTIRLHYANCKTFNADFDGDEINLHFPQSEPARAEGYFLADADHQYISQTSGEPLRGLIQDHVVSGVLLTKRDTFFTREQFQQLIYSSCSPSIRGRLTITEMPCILKPVPLYSGKQVISTVLKLLTHGQPPLSLASKSKVSGSLWAKSCEEGDVIVRGNDLLCGVLDKNQFGASKHGLVHAVFEVYGAAAAGKLLSIFGRLFTFYLMDVGFTCGMDDLVLSASAERLRASTLATLPAVTHDAGLDFVRRKGVQMPEHELRWTIGQNLREPNDGARLDAVMKTALNPVASKVMKDCLNSDGLLKRFPWNNFTMMTASGAKGTPVNHSQISCLLGQQDLEGRRVPTMISGRSLPCFDAHETAARAGGFVQDRFLTGVRPQEYFFHCMAGREGLVDTAVKTSRSGYLQRCLIKHLETLRVSYDNTVRDSDGSVVQFLYGDDGLDPGKVAFLQRFDFIASNYAAFSQQLSLAEVCRRLDTKRAPKLLKSALKTPSTQDPVMASLNPSRFVGSISERAAAEFEEFAEQNKAMLKDLRKRHNLSTRDLRKLFFVKYMRSLAEPGEAVGLIAAQGVGEPSTQMTLNTFHLAGVGTVNVTLGIPRLREIVMTAKKQIATPSMRLPLRAGVSVDTAHTIAEAMTRIVITDCITETSVEERFVESSEGFTHDYVVRLPLVAQSVLEEHGITRAHLQSALGTVFVKRLSEVVRKQLRQRAAMTAHESIDDNQADVAHYGRIGDDGDGNDGDEERDHTHRRGVERDDAAAAGDDTVAAVDDDDAAPRVRRAARSGDSGSDGDGDDDDDEGDNVGAAAAAAAKSKTAAGVFGVDPDDVDEVDSDGDVPMSAAAAPASGGSAAAAQTAAAVGVSDPALQAAIAADAFELGKVPFSSTFVRLCGFDRLRNEFVVFVRTTADARKLLMSGFVRQLADEIAVRQVPGVTRAFVDEPSASNRQQCSVVTEGVNLAYAFGLHEYVDVNAFSTNDIHAVLSLFGVEAARATIVREIRSVFAAYGIGVDPRHLSLIADYMTFEGAYKPFNRTGITTSASPLQKMSFETTVSFLRDAFLSGQADPLDSPSSRIVVGGLVRGGTGAFDLLQPLL